MLNIPKVRFKNFSDAWEQRKLGEVAECLDSMRVPINAEEREKIPGNIPYYGAGNIQGYINKYLFDEELVLLLEDGDAFDDYLTKSIAQYITGKTWVNNHAHVLRPHGHAYFLYSILAHKDIRQWTQLAGASRKKLVQDAMLNIDIFVPSREEQTIIGDCFSNLDNLITLHQRKCDETKELKKYMLKKMFPRNGEPYPEIRFEGFSDAWEQRKLGEVFVEYSEKKHEELPPLTIIQGGGTILREESDRALQYDKSSLSGYKMVKKDDFIVHLRSFEGGLEKANTDGIISPAYHTFHGDNTDSSFYYSFFRSRRFIDVLLKPHVYGIRDGKSIDIDGMKSIMIPVPSYEEQKAIGEYIETLDNLITLHQRKCDDLKEMKQYMLQNMFPQSTR